MSADYSENKESDDGKKAGYEDPPEWERAACKLIRTEWERGDVYVSEMNRLYEDVFALLRGERPEKRYDWQSDVAINKAFQIVWTAVPYFVQKIFGAKPIIGVKSVDKKGAWQREQVLEFWHNLHPATGSQHTPFVLALTSLLVRTCLNGVGYMKKTWHQKLKRKQRRVEVPTAVSPDGSIVTKTVTQTETLPLEDWPYNEVVNNMDIRVDWLLQPGQSCRQGRFIIHRFLTDLGALYESDIDYFNLGRIRHGRMKDRATGYKQDHGQVRGKDQQDEFPESDIYTDVECYERQGIFPVYKKKKEGRWVLCTDTDKDESVYERDDVVMRHMVATYASCGEDILIRFEPNPYNELNYIDCHLYLDPERWQSTGMVEPVKDLLTALNDNLNASFDEIWQNMFPPVIVNKYALWDWDTMQYAPGQKWLVGGDPASSALFRNPTNITSDAWQKHILIDAEIDKTSSINQAIQGLGKEKAATTNVLNAELTSGKLDFLVRMIELTALIPSAQMDVRFAKRFAHPQTFKLILGEPFMYRDFLDEIYRFVPGASSVKLEHQRVMEVQQDTVLIQVLSAIPNPNTPKIVNVILKNIFRNRDWPELAQMLDEEYFEPTSDAGNIQMLNRQLGAGSPSNQNNLPMSQPERGVRQLSYARR